MDGYTITRLQPGVDAGRLQQFLEECSDYYLLHEGCPTPADAGEYELSVVPEGRSPADLYVWAMEDPDRRLVAVAQVLPDYPKPQMWWIALLLVAPAFRQRGVGPQLLRHVTTAASAAGGTSLQLAVSLRNPRGQKFWEATGFRDTGQVVRIVARNGHVDSGRIMVRDAQELMER